VGDSFSIEELASLLEMLDKNKITAFELERNGEKLKLKRGEPEHVVSHVTTVTDANAVAQQADPAAAALPEMPAPATKSNYHEIKSPMVGTFYSKPSPNAAPYVQMGDSVKKGDVLCIVEAMKLMNEIEAEVSGKIVEICLEDAQMAEYGEVLFRIDPTG